MSVTGKTIARIVERPTDPEYGYAHEDTLLLKFTDGTALRIRGHSYEEVDLSHDLIDREAVRAYERAAQGRRETERLQHLRYEELASLSDEERAEREEKRRAGMSPLALAVDDAMRDVFGSLRRDMNRVSFGAEFVIPTQAKEG